MKTTMKFLISGCITFLLLFNSCSKDDGGNSIITPPAAIATSINIALGDNQTAEVLTALTNPVEILVNDQNGSPFAGTTINFSVDEGSLSTATATTNTNGIATVSWTLGASVGSQTLIVTAFQVDGTTPLAGSPLSVTATATPEPLVAESISLVSGDNQTAVIEKILTNPIEILVNDQNGDPFSDTTVNFSVAEGSLSETTVTTNANGVATTSWTLGASMGTQILTVTAIKADETTPLTGSPISVTATAILPTIVGEFNHGGVVFYVDETGEHGLVCAVSDLSMAEWGCMGTEITGASNLGLGSGAQNTLDIIAECTTTGIAADLCTNLDLNSFTDWFLPSRDALSEMYFNKDAINATATGNGGTEFVNNSYWSSSEYNANPTNQIYGRDFSNGLVYVFNKVDVRNIRPVRAF